MKTLLILFFSFLTLTTFAQQSVTWIGGTPGNETNWNESRNWSNNRVPNEFSDVFIKDVSTTSFSAPVIKEGLIELNSITVTSNAKLTISPSAKLIIYSHAEGLIKENINIQGTLLVMDELTDSDTDKIVNLEKN